MNRVSLVGRLTSKPELRYTGSQIAYTKFSIAVNRVFKRDEVDFLNVTAWRKQAENICQYLDKGSLVSVDGRIQTGSYTDQEGNKKYSFDIIADSVQFLESKAKAQERMQNEENNVNPYAFENNEEYQDLENQDDIYSNMGDNVALDDADLDD